MTVFIDKMAIINPMIAIETGTVTCQKRSLVASECLGSAEEVKEKKDIMVNEPQDEE